MNEGGGGGGDQKVVLFCLLTTKVERVLVCSLLLFCHGCKGCKIVGGVWGPVGATHVFVVSSMGKARDCVALDSWWCLLLLLLFVRLMAFLLMLTLCRTIFTEDVFLSTRIDRLITHADPN